MMYYNEINKQKAAALQELMADGFIPKGDIDTRSIADVMPSDLAGYHQWHFFAGIGLWTRALYLAGYGNTRGICTGSCPCQPFSTAGAQRAQKDERHLYPEWSRLIRECRFPIIIGEQVSSAIALGWLDAVADDLENQAYAFWPAVLPAASVGKPHKRDRLFFMGISDGARRIKGHESSQAAGYRIAPIPADWPAGGVLEHPASHGCAGSALTGSDAKAYEHGAQGEGCAGQPARTGSAGDVAYAGGAERRAHAEGRSDDADRPNPIRWEAAGRPEFYGAFAVANTSSPGPEGWQPGMDSRGRAEFIDRSVADVEWIACPDGKYRPVKPGIQLLVDGYPERVGCLHAAGDGINPEVAAEFIQAGLSNFSPTLEGELYAYR